MGTEINTSFLSGTTKVNLGSEARGKMKDNSSTIAQVVQKVMKANPLPKQEAVQQGNEALSDLDAVAEELEKMNQMVQREIQFRVDKSTGRTIITVRDAETNEVIREIPPEEVRSLALKLQDGSGLLDTEV